MASAIIAALVVTSLLSSFAAVRYYRMSLTLADNLTDATQRLETGTALVADGVAIIEALEKDLDKLTAHNRHLQASVNRSIETGGEYAAQVANFERDAAALIAENARLRVALGAQREIIRVMSPYQALPTQLPWGKN